MRGRRLRALTGSLPRALALLSLPAGAVALSAEGAARRLAGQDPEQVRQRLRVRHAARTRRVLGELKGGALKAGQLLSTVEALFPADPEDTWREALTGLQEDAGALPFADVEPVLVAELGPGWRGLFDAFDERAAAAASLGQVHRGSGRPPGQRWRSSCSTRACARPWPPTPRVLVSAWLDGTPLPRVAAEADQPERDRVAGLYQRFLVSGPERVGLLHTDPHPGNVRVLPDGRLGVLDFGSTLSLAGMPEAFGRLIRALLADEPGDVLARLREAGFLRPGVDVDVTKLVDYMAPFTVPARHPTFRFSRAWLRREFGRVNDRATPTSGWR